MRQWFRRARRPNLLRFQAKVTGQSAPYAQMEFVGRIGNRRIDVPARTTLTFRSAQAETLDLSHQVIDNWVAFGTQFANCDFRGTSFRGGVFGHLPQVTYRRCNFQGADIRYVSPLWARFEGCDFRDARLDEWNETGAEFIDCVFSGRLLRVKFAGKPWIDSRARHNPPRTANEFSGNDFSQADLVDCSFSKAIRLTANKMPSGPDYFLIGEWSMKRELVRDQVLSWPASETQAMALTWLDVYSKWNYKDQDELIVRKDELAVGLEELLVGLR